MDPDQSEVQKPRRLWKVIFVLSLALNVAIVGVVIGATWRFQGSGAQMASKVLDSGSIYLRALGKKHRRELGRKMRPARGETKNSRAEIIQGFDQAIAVLRGEPFDSDAFEQVMQAHSTRAEMRMQEARSILLNHLIALSAAERAAYADRLEQALRGGKQRKP